MLLAFFVDLVRMIIVYVEEVASRLWGQKIVGDVLCRTLPWIDAFDRRPYGNGSCCYAGRPCGGSACRGGSHWYSVLNGGRELACRNSNKAGKEQ